MGKWTDSATRFSVVLILVLTVAGFGCGPKKAVSAPPVSEPVEAVETAEAAVGIEDLETAGETAGAETSAEPDPEQAAETLPEAALSEEEVSAIFQEAKNLYHLGQETITSGGDAEEGRKILEQAADLYLQIIEGGGESSVRSEALLDYITTKDYFARQCRDVKEDTPGAIALYADIIAAIGDSINSQKQFYYLVAAELQLFEMNDSAAARDLYAQALDYCEGIEPGNFSSCTDWEMLQIHHTLGVIGRELDGDGWTGFQPQTISLPNRDFENYYLLAAGLLDSAEMDPAIWSKETGYRDDFYEGETNRKTLLDVLLINCFHGKTLAASDPVLGDGIVELNFQRLLEQFPEHPATMIMLVKQSIHTRKMLRPEEADVYSGMAEELAAKMNITLIVDQDAPPVQEFLRREYPVPPGSESPGPEVTPVADPVAD